VKEVVYDSVVADIVYVGKSHECILVTTKNRRLYFSQNAGQDWEEITGKIEPQANVDLEVDHVIVNNNDKTVVILQTKRRVRRPAGQMQSQDSAAWHPYTFISEDAGKTWRKAWGKHHGLHSWAAHPTKRDWALVSWWTGDCSPNKKKQLPKKDDEEAEKDDEESDNAGEACVHRLMFTKDLGRNFVQIATYVVQFSWGTKESGKENRIYYTAYRNLAGDQGKLSLWTSEVDFNYVIISRTGRPSSATMALQFGNKFMVSGEFVMVAKVKNEAAQTVNLMVSKDGGKTFNIAMLPQGLGDMEEKWYTVLDTSGGEVILHINENSETRDTGRVFISDKDGYKFTQALTSNIRSAQGDCAFDKVLSLDGVYIANVAVQENGDQSMAQEKLEEEEKVEAEAGQGTATDKKHGRATQGEGTASSRGKTAKDERTIRTVISFDKGGAWNFLKAPRVDSMGKPYPCEGQAPEKCALHLHSSSAWNMYAPFYSTDNAVGIIMGTGNVGASLKFTPQDVNTYLSRDGGLSWLEAHKGAFIYEYGDHGGLITMADDLKKRLK
jgi:hypothetical protein